MRVLVSWEWGMGNKERDAPHSLFPIPKRALPSGVSLLSRLSASAGSRFVLAARQRILFAFVLGLEPFFVTGF
jgi:hypothetical protein